MLIVATPSEYSIIEQALKKLDVASRQVMIEVTIAEVKLTDTLSFGVDWIFKGAAPPIDTRSVQTLLSVPSGQTMVMGGLIQETKGNANKGLPLLNRIPILGGLFGSETMTNDRSELVLFITPRVVNDTVDYSRVIEDLRRKMERLDSVFPPKPNKVSGNPDN